MRTMTIACVIAAGLAFGGVAEAKGYQINDANCGYSTDYDVTVQPAGIAFSRTDGHPGDVFMHDGHLRVDGREMAVSASTSRTCGR